MAEEKNKVQGGTLYLVGTPIGNMADLSERAKKVLSEVDFIAAEDTRNSYKLLSLIGVQKELVSYHEHNKKSAGERIVARLLSGESCALITDAGMPAISDPGEDLVRLCAESAVKVVCVPGPSAVVSALAMSGLSTRKFAFEGFLSAKASERRRELEEWLRGEGGHDDEEALALMRKVLEPGVASERDVLVFASRLQLYPETFDRPFVGGRTSLSFREAIEAAGRDPRVRLAAYLKSNELAVFGGGRGEDLSRAAEAYTLFLRELVRGKMPKSDLSAMLDRADELLRGVVSGGK